MAEGRQTVWIVSETYAPELTSTGYYMTGLAEGLAGEYDVHVMAGQPTYAARGTLAPWRERLNGVDVHRVRGFTLDKNRLALRLVNVCSLTLNMLAALIANLRANSIVLVVTNPPTLPTVVRIASWVCGARVILLVHDVYPEAMIAAGLLTPSRLSARLLQLFSRIQLRVMDSVVACGRDMAALLRAKGGGCLRVDSIPNWASDDLIESGESAPNRFRQQLDLEHRFVVQYAGNIGRVQDIELLVEAAQSWKREAPEIVLLVIGGGARRQWLEQRVRELALDNVTLVAEQGRAGQAEYLRACDLAVMALVPGMLGVGVPSRLYNIMATGRAVVAAVDGGSEPARVIAEDEVGWVTPPGDARALAETVVAAMRNPEERARRAARGRHAAVLKYRRGTILQAYRAEIEQLRKLNA